jgi:hypothetical protein
MVGSPMDSTGFARLAHMLAERYTVVTYDPHGIGRSIREDLAQEITPERQAGDAHRMLSGLGCDSADIFAGRARASRDRSALPDRDQVRAQFRTSTNLLRQRPRLSASAAIHQRVGRSAWLSLSGRKPNASGSTPRRI